MSHESLRPSHRARPTAPAASATAPDSRLPGLRTLLATFATVLMLLATGATAGATSAPSSTGHTFSFDGHTYTAACALVPIVGRCQVVASGSNVFHKLDDLAQGTPVGVDGTITWQADSPVTQTFSVFLVGQGERGQAVFDRASGTSPLAFAFDVTSFEGQATDWEIHIHALSRQDTPFVILTQELRQEFALEGTVWTSP